MDSAVEFQGLVLGHLDSLYNYALVLTRRTEDAEDLLQEVLVRGFQSFATYDRSLSFKGWMFTIIKNTCGPAGPPWTCWRSWPWSGGSWPRWSGRPARPPQN